MKLVLQLLFHSFLPVTTFEVKKLGQQKWYLHTVLLQIRSGNWLEKIGILDLSLIKLLQNQQPTNNFLYLTVYINWADQHVNIAENVKIDFRAVYDLWFACDICIDWLIDWLLIHVIF